MRPFPVSPEPRAVPSTAQALARGRWVAGGGTEGTARAASAPGFTLCSQRLRVGLVCKRLLTAPQARRPLAPFPPFSPREPRRPAGSQLEPAGIGLWATSRPPFTSPVSPAPPAAVTARWESRPRWGSPPLVQSGPPSPGLGRGAAVREGLRCRAAAGQ